MSAKAEKLLKRLRQTLSGWHAHDLLALYEHYRFTIRSKGKHYIITHQDLPTLRCTLTRSSGELLPAYAKDALKSIEDVLELDEQKTSEQEQDHERRDD